MRNLSEATWDEGLKKRGVWRQSNGYGAAPAPAGRDQRQRSRKPYRFATVIESLRTVRERECDVACASPRRTRVPLRRRGPSVARGDNDVLTAVHLVGGGCRVSGEWKRRFPQELAGRFIERPEFIVVERGRDEHEAARRHNGPSVVLATRILDSFGR